MPAPVPPLVKKTSALYRCTLLDEFDVLVPASALTTLTLTLYDLQTYLAGLASGLSGVAALAAAIINGRNAQNVLNANNVTVYNTLQTGADGVSYNLAWDLQPADSPIVNAPLAVETHVALFQATWGTSGAFNHEVRLPVENVIGVS